MEDVTYIPVTAEEFNEHLAQYEVNHRQKSEGYPIIEILSQESSWPPYQVRPVACIITTEHGTFYRIVEDSQL